MVFDGPPAAASGRFVETEIEGSGVGIGEWEEGQDGLWYLRFTEADLLELVRRVSRCGRIIEETCARPPSPYRRGDKR